LTDVTQLTAASAADLLATRAISAEELTRAYIARIEARELAVKAFAHFDPAKAIKQARAIDSARAAGRLQGPLAGLPVGIKDIIDTADMPTENGSAVFKGRQPANDAACVATLRQAGCVIIGKTVTTELATLTPGKTHNPVNLGHSPGGSSSGSAAGVADGMFPLALATQTGGSIIRPASFCGIYGLKPTYGMISRAGVTMQSHTLDTVGVYGRSVTDLALLADALDCFDPNDAQSYPRSQSPSLSRMLQTTLNDPPKFLFVKTPAWDAADEAAKAALHGIVKKLGNRIDERPMASLAPAVTYAAAVSGAENAFYYGGLADRAGDAFSAGLRARIEAGRKVTGEAYLTAIQAREALAADVDLQLALAHGVVLTLAATGPAPKTLASTGNPAFNAPWTYLGHPCVTLPLLSVGGLPLGIQLVGARRGDAHLLRTAQWLVDHCGTQR
jgi:Asp-tRNA(Asn)/Glu-tRNA(Gln) amidotransferase A subunit family amidase